MHIFPSSSIATGIPTAVWSFISDRPMRPPDSEQLAQTTSALSDMASTSRGDRTCFSSSAGERMELPRARGLKPSISIELPLRPPPKAPFLPPPLLPSLAFALALVAKAARSASIRRRSEGGRTSSDRRSSKEFEVYSCKNLIFFLGLGGLTALTELAADAPLFPSPSLVDSSASICATVELPFSLLVYHTSPMSKPRPAQAT
mmetsp:Transcript_16660/g.47811  ORF Transcript_16660/g.47811 Transcript_16660/m.47811 type:complete len:203 (+) Transcript_16660:3055-3663(+)